NKLSFIAGDIFEAYFKLENIDKSLIEEVVFTCSAKGVQATCEYSEDEEAYCLRLESAETAELETGIANYDLTIKFLDGQNFTAIYENALNILPKRNKLNEV
ncbi:MAG: hypothetical protein ACI4QN_00285, partial [Candidatus Coproplasma sp.]